MMLPRRTVAPFAALLVALGCSANPDTAYTPPSDGAVVDRAPTLDATTDAGPRADVASRTDVSASDAAAVLMGACDPAARPQRAGCVCAPRTTTPCYPGAVAQVNVGVCRAGTARCNAQGEFGLWAACMGAVGPSPERCDGVDNNCDGRVDDGCACRPGTSEACYGGAAATRGVGLCRVGARVCVAGAGGVGSTWGACAGQVLPAREVCNGLDDDCNGRVDDGVGCTCVAGMTRSCYSGLMGTQGVGPCRGGTQACLAGGTGWATCVGERTPSAELCNMIDDDCNGRVDDNPACTPPSATCPAPITGRAGTAVTLDATTSAGASCRWSVVTRPAGAGAEGTFGDPMRCDTTFSSVIVGTYTVRLEATDAMGRTVVCMTTITLTGQGLRVELSWTTTGDLDLHMLHPMAPAWFSSPLDCYYANTMPTWDGAVGTSPRLDVDNVTAMGPENIRIDAPAAGATYRVGVHAYSRVDAGAPSTVRIYCGNTTMALRSFTRTVTSRATAADNDMWLIADVTMNAAGGCTIAPLDRVVRAADARAAR